MTYYKQLDDRWAFIPTKVGNWKAGMLGYRGVKPKDLNDLHIIASKPSLIGSYSDAHVSFVSGGKTKHVYYQLNGDRLDPDYVLSPNSWQSSPWVNYPGLREMTEAEVAHFIAHWRKEGRLDRNPAAAD